MKFTDNKNLQDRIGATKRSKSKFDLLKKPEQDNSKSKAIEAFCVGPDETIQPSKVLSVALDESFSGSDWVQEHSFNFDHKNIYDVKKHSIHIYANLVNEIPEEAKQNITAYPYEDFEKYFQRAKLLVTNFISDESYKSMFRQHWYECQDIVLYLERDLKFYGSPTTENYSTYKRRVNNFVKNNSKRVIPKQHCLAGISLFEYLDKYNILIDEPLKYSKPWKDLMFSYDAKTDEAVAVNSEDDKVLTYEYLEYFENLNKDLEIEHDKLLREIDVLQDELNGLKHEFDKYFSSDDELGFKLEDLTECEYDALVRSWGEDNDDVDTLEVLEEFVADTAPQEQQKATDAIEAIEATEVIEESPIEAKQPRFDFDILRNTFIRFVFIPSIVSLMFSLYWRGIAESTDTVMRVFNWSAVLFILCAGFYASVSCIKSVSKQDRLLVAKASVKSFRVFYDVLFSSYLFLVLIASRLFHNDLNLHSAFNNFALLLLLGVVGVFVFHKELRNYLVEEEALIKSKI